MAIITVELSKGGGYNNRKGSQSLGDYDEFGLLPETYSEPDFPGMGGRVEFEGGQKPTNFGSNRFDQEGQKSRSSNNQNDLKGLGKNIPNLKPNERSGTNCPVKNFQI